MSTEEKAQHLQTVLSTLAEPQDLFFAVDGSGSVSDDQFETMKFSIRTLVNHLNMDDDPTNPRYRVGAIQFDNKVYIICGLTSDRIAVTTSVVTMPQKKGGTNTGLALMTCLNQFQADNRGAHRTIILLTDGDISGAKKILTDLIKAGVTLISVGVGLSDKAQKNVMSISNSAIFVRDFKEMNKVVSRLSVKPGNPPKVNFRTRSSKKASFDIVSTVPFSLVEIQGIAEGSNQWVSLANSQSNVAWVNNLQSNTIYKIRAKIQTGSGWSAWSSEIMLRTMRDNPETSILKNPNLHQKVLDSIKFLQQFSIPPQLHAFGIEYLNIALMGRIGNGKSAYFNTIWSIMSGIYGEPQTARNDIVTVTLNISKRFLVNNNHNAIRLCDTYGWKGGNSWNQELEFFLDGALKDGYKENEPVLDSLNLKPTVGDRIHGVIIIYELPSVFTETHINELKIFFHKLNSKGYQPIIILTKPDLIEEADIEGKLYEIFDSGIIDQHIQTFSQNTKIPVSNIFPVMNYRGPYSSREWVLERLALNAFEAAINSSRVKIATDLKKYILVLSNGKTLGSVAFNGNSETSLEITRGLIIESLSSLRGSLFNFKGSIGVIDNSVEKTTPFVRVGKQNPEHGYWQVEIVLQQQQHQNNTPQNLSSFASKSHALIPNEFTIIKDNEILGVIFNNGKKLDNLSEMRNLILSQLDVNDFQFVTSQNIDVSIEKEDTTRVIQCLRDVNYIVIKDTSMNEEQAIVVLKKDKSSVGVCFMEDKSISLRQLKKLLAEQEVPTGKFVFLYKGIPITEKQLDIMQAKQIMFEHNENTSFCIDQR